MSIVLVCVFGMMVDFFIICGCDIIVVEDIIKDLLLLFFDLSF